MSNVIPFPSTQNKRVRLNRDAIAAVARFVALRPGPSEDREDFVARIVRAYFTEGGERS